MKKLRNVVPRQGTETFRKVFTIVMYFVIEKCSSPTGDGNSSTGNSVKIHKY